MSEKLVVNPIECKGNGACAELLPEMIALDEWGYPIIDPRPVPPALDRDARAAVSACPTLALRLLRSLCSARGVRARHGHPGSRRASARSPLSAPRCALGSSHRSFGILNFQAVFWLPSTL
jgi:ferredoxin